MADCFAMMEFLRGYGEQVVTVLLAFAAAAGAVWAFYRERGYETVRKRYLEEGLDTLAGDMDYALSVERQLFQRALNIIRQFRELGEQMPKHLLSEPRPRLDDGRFRSVTSWRVHALTGSEAFWGGAQLAFARTRQLADLIDDDLVFRVAQVVTGERGLTTSRDEFCRFSASIIYSYHVVIQKDFAETQAQLMKLVGEFERHAFGLKDVPKFRSRAVVGEAVASAERSVERSSNRKRDDKGVFVLTDEERAFLGERISGPQPTPPAARSSESKAS